MLIYDTQTETSTKTKVSVDKCPWFAEIRTAMYANGEVHRVIDISELMMDGQSFRLTTPEQIDGLKKIIEAVEKELKNKPITEELIELENRLDEANTILDNRNLKTC